MKKVKLLNGPNLNMLGIRNPAVYGTTTLKEIEEELISYAFNKGVVLDCFQSNCEGKLIDEIHSCHKRYDGIILNAGAYTHYSYAIRDAIEAVEIPTVEVHLSDIHKREPFRHVSVIEDVCVKQICGRGKQGYFDALDDLLNEYIK
ncbi:MAG: type II 3-dehydroquinate dehydratase [Clostridia bacterium]|nr:type II 3-dehydroquinate dehydratase [Clostridia bacterium]